MIQFDQVVTEKSSETKSTEKVAYPDWRVWGNKDEFRKDTGIMVSLMRGRRSRVKEN